MIILEILVTAVSHHPQAILLSRRPISLNQRNFGLKVFEGLCDEARTLLPKEHRDLGDLTVIDGPLIDATLSMYWADYRDGTNKAKLHIGFDLNCSIPRKIFLTDGRGDERPFVSQILSAGQTGILDRYYHCHKNFDQWQQEGTHFVCRIRNKTKKTVIRANKVTPGSIVFYDAVDLCGTPRRLSENAKFYFNHTMYSSSLQSKPQHDVVKISKLPFSDRLLGQTRLRTSFVLSAIGLMVSITELPLTAMILPASKSPWSIDSDGI